MRRVLSSRFFARDTRLVARNLLGKYLVRRREGRTEGHMIVEVEAYDGLDDMASHARFGLTERNAPMFGPPGAWYVYFIYGMHEMLNVVTREAGYPGAVLIRALAESPGPGRLTRELEITRALNARRAIPANGLWIEDRGARIPERFIRKTARIGVSYAGEIWEKKKYRFVIAKGYFEKRDTAPKAARTRVERRFRP